MVSAVKRVLATSLVCLLAAGDSAFAQQQPAATSQPGTASTNATPDFGGAPAPLANTLMDGTAVKMRLGETISSADVKTGQQVPFEVIEDVVVQGVTVIAKGSTALATVTEAHSKKSMGRGGKLDVSVDSTRLVNGQKVQLRAVRDAQGGGHVGAMTGAMVATAIVFFPAAPLFLFIKGKDITIPKGTEVMAFVQGDTKLDLASIASMATPGSLMAPAQGAQVASLTVDSLVAGADIEVDGSFVGSTPSTVTVTPGQHTIAVKKKGYSDWTRPMNVSGSGVRVSADLEKLVAAN